MRIKDIRATLHRHEIDLPNIGKSIESRIFVFVEVDTDSGVSGFGITGSILPWAIIACIHDHLKPALIDRDIYHTEEIHAHVWKKLKQPRLYASVCRGGRADVAAWRTCHGRGSGGDALQASDKKTGHRCTARICGYVF